MNGVKSSNVIFFFFLPQTRWEVLRYYGKI